MCISAGVLTQDSLLTLGVKVSESALVTGDGLESILGPLFDLISLYTKDELEALVKLAALPQLQGTPNACAYPAGAIPTGCGTCNYSEPRSTKSVEQIRAECRMSRESVRLQQQVRRQVDRVSVQHPPKTGSARARRRQVVSFLASGGGVGLTIRCRGKQQLCLIAGASGKSRNDFECIDTATDLESCTLFLNAG